MTVLLDPLVSFLEEAVYKTSLIVAASTQTFLLGGIDTIDLKSPTYSNLIPYYFNDSYEPAGHSWKTIPVRESIPVAAKNGVLLYFVMGDHSVGAGPPYTHTLIDDNTTSDLPSFTMHVENTEGTHVEDILRNYTGCRVDTLTLASQLGGPLMYNLDIVGCKIEDNITDSVVRLTSNLPELPAVAVDTRMYLNNTGTITWAASPVAEVQSVGVTVGNNINQGHEHQLTDSEWPNFGDKTKKSYRVELGVIVQSKTLFTALKGKTLAEFIVKWARDADDYIELTATNCAVKEATIPVQSPKELPEGKITLEPLSCSWEVKDTIPDYESLAAA